MGLTGVRARAAAATLGAAALAALLASGLLESGPSLCPLRRLLGWPCASCGMTRALGCLCRGDAAGAWLLHPAAFPLALAGCAAIALLLAEVVSGRERLSPAWRRVRGGAGWALAAALAAGWILRTSRGAPAIV